MITCVLVNFKQSSTLIPLVEKLVEERDVKEINIIDNSSDIKERSDLEKNKHDKVKIYYKNNIGFAGACNFGAGKSSKDYLAFINPDIIYTKGTIIKLVKTLKKSKAKAIGPVILTHKDQFQETAGYFSKISLKFWQYIFLTPIKISCPPNQLTNVEWLTGAFFIIDRSVFESVGGFDEKFFMYWEDIDLFYRLMKQRKVIVYDPSVKVVHLAHQSINQIKLGTKTKWYDKSKFYFISKHRGKLTAYLAKLLKY